MNVIEEIKNLNLPLGQYLVIGSGTLAALGIREAADIDIAVMPALYARIRASGEWEEEERYGKVFLKRGSFEINPELHWEDYPVRTEEAIARALIIDDVAFMNLDELTRFKKALGRPKDLADIELIVRYLQNVADG